MTRDYSEQKKESRAVESSQVSAGRILLYSSVSILCNICLGWFLMYVIQQNTSIKWITLASKPYQLILEVVLRGIFLISPLFLSYIVNNALMQLFFMKERCPRGIGIYAFLLILLTQISVLYLLFSVQTLNAPIQETVTAVMRNERHLNGGTLCLKSL